MQCKNWISVFVSKALVDTMLLGNTLPSIRESEIIKIGVIVPLTGDLAIYGQPVKNSIDLAVENYNAKGGILGKKITLIIYDSKADPTEAINAFEKLATIDKVDGVIGGVITATALVLAPLSLKYNLPMITPSAVNPAVTKGYKTVFRTSFISPYEAKGLAEFAYEKLYARKAAVLYNSSEQYSIQLAEDFKNAFEAKGAKIVAYERYTDETKDFNSIIMKIKAINPEILFIPDYYSTAALIVQQVKQAGLDLKILGGEGWEGWETVEGGKEIFEDTYFSNHYAVDIPTPENKNFIQSYKKKFNENPNVNAALGYDAVAVMLEGIKKAGTTKSADLIEKLEKTNFQGATGHISFDKDHNPIKPIYMFRIQEGQNILIQRLYPK